MAKVIKYFIMSFVLLTIIPAYFNFSLARAIDSDQDGWPDKYEEKLGADPRDSKDTPDPQGDLDADGLVNEKEKEWGTDPTDPDTDNDNLSDSQEVTWRKSDPLNPDTDNDGLNDFNEVLKGTDPRVPDSDGDGWLDKAEIDAASDPNNYSSTPREP
ncbi:MAG: hypothetical protein JRE65_08145 [Deltaproteobacteria bacterium]|jgi:hypothetical protein|nr:hypothetical protein [Deltaproteobacteria bacterium]